MAPMTRTTRVQTQTDCYTIERVVQRDGSETLTIKSISSGRISFNNCDEARVVLNGALARLDESVS
jgi:hypothetical protein